MIDYTHIDLPYGLRAPVKRPSCMNELREEVLFYHDVLNTISVVPDWFEEMSDATMTEVQDCAGTISIWYKNNHKKSIKLIQIKLYFYVRHSNLRPSDWAEVLNYLINYHNVFSGQVIMLTFVQGGMYWKTDFAHDETLQENETPKHIFKIHSIAKEREGNWIVSKYNWVVFKWWV